LAQQRIGASLSEAIISNIPPSLHGYSLLLNYHPPSLVWNQFSLYFDGGFSRFWVNSTPNNKSLNIYSAAPVIRYTWESLRPLTPYLELSIGPAYLSRTRLENRNLGIHFAFQDRLGMGILLSSSQRCAIGMHALHYSNARLSSHNSGITISLMLDVSYQFM
jgi:lipid A 3-O-deacylase